LEQKRTLHLVAADAKLSFRRPLMNGSNCSRYAQKA
jgi:hypothetical protein